MVPVQFSARHRALWSGNQKCISAGASVSGVSWNSMRTPSRVSSCPVSVISTVGGTIEMDPTGTPLHKPWSTWPRGSQFSNMPYW